uniref:LAGLIDADG homing endonuclease n=1 Tax=Termitomyces sp. TaxID=1916073 RepID=A0A386TYU8_9AGAR|nr:LAGLIDADG homing endonuclease [Termitomyces sp.]AYE93413.1 LAGLIDADG homing endonuclease [Termitomyces sp.]
MKKVKKVIPANIADHLTPRSLAFWIMDDGQQVKTGGVTLCTDSYNKEEVNILREALKNKFNLETSIHNKKGFNGAIYERIYIKKEGFEEIKPSLVPHMHESMYYKINKELNITQDSSDIMDTGGDTDIFDIGGF